MAYLSTRLDCRVWVRTHSNHDWAWWQRTAHGSHLRIGVLVESPEIEDADEDDPEAAVIKKAAQAKGIRDVCPACSMWVTLPRKTLVNPSPTLTVCVTCNLVHHKTCLTASICSTCSAPVPPAHAIGPIAVAAAAAAPAGVVIAPTSISDDDALVVWRYLEFGMDAKNDVRRFQYAKNAFINTLIAAAREMSRKERTGGAVDFLFRARAGATPLMYLKHSQTRLDEINAMAD